MWIFIAILLIWILGIFTLPAWLKRERSYRRGEDIFIVLLVWSMLAGFAGVFLGPPIAAATTGFYPKYSKGERIGYFTKVSYKGILWKTHELQVQVGTGQMAALQAPHPFSCDQKTADEIKSHLGHKARIHYSEWLIMPYRKGASGYWIDKIEWLDVDAEDKAPVVEDK